MNINGKIRIIGLREQGEFGWDWGIVADSVADVYQNPKKYIDQVPEHERYNLHMTQALTVKKRELLKQDVLFFDVDNIEIDRMDHYIAPIVRGISPNLRQDQCGIAFSGHGIHVAVYMGQAITDEEEFKDLRKLYKFICRRIELELEQAELVGKVDEGVFAPKHLIRVPGSENRKKGQGAVTGHVIQPKMDISANYDILLEASASCFLVEANEQISPNALVHMPPIDRGAVLEGCEFLKWCKENQEEVTEPLWYAMLTVVSRIDRDLCHEYSEKHPKYNVKETELKIEQALLSTGPRTCDNICGMWDGCKQCPHFGKIVSPITIKGDDYILTEETGFRYVKKVGGGKIAYYDLVKFFERKHPYVSMRGTIFIWENHFWREVDEFYVFNFALRHVKPDPSHNERKEFFRLLECSNLRTTDFFGVDSKLNCRNGVLDFKTKVLTAHSPEWGFKYVLDYDYDPTAKAPRFEQFLDEVTLGNKDLRAILEEFGGYAFSGIDASIGHKALILVGDGANGKSVYMNTIAELFPEEAQSALMLRHLKAPFYIAQLHGKLFNLTPEAMPDDLLTCGEIFKAIVDGNRIMADIKNKPPINMQSRAKFIIGCNKMPRTNDDSGGMTRRLLFVPFKASFEGNPNKDVHLKEKLVKENAGILNIFMQGFDRFMKQGHFTYSDDSEDVLTRFREDADNVRLWFDDSCELTQKEEDFVSIPDARLAYYRWCKENNIEKSMQASIRTFAIQVQKISRVIKKAHKKVDGKAVNVFLGMLMNEKGDF